MHFADEGLGIWLFGGWVAGQNPGVTHPDSGRRHPHERVGELDCTSRREPTHDASLAREGGIRYAASLGLEVGLVGTRAPWERKKESVSLTLLCVQHRQVTSLNLHAR